jgi:hypothetical protein
MSILILLVPVQSYAEIRTFTMVTMAKRKGNILVDGS